MWRIMFNRCSILVQSRRFAARRNTPEPKFTNSAAFQGRGARGIPALKTDHYSSDAYDNKKMLSAIGSILAVIIYFGWLREPSDLDEIWNAPPHILTSNLERKMLREEIKQAQEKGMDTALLKAQLEYVDVKEEALRIQFEKQSKK